MNDAASGEGAIGGRGALPLVAVGVAGILQFVVGFFTVTAIGLVGVPIWAIAVLVVAWALSALVIVRTARRSPLLALLAPIANGVLLWALVGAGQAWWGWTS